MKQNIWQRFFFFKTKNSIVSFSKGEIGTGKTTFANFLLTISEKKNKVLSPTFPIVNIYKLKKLKFGITIYTELKIKKNFLL